jgi:hypothetical protein
MEAVGPLSGVGVVNAPSKAFNTVIAEPGVTETQQLTSDFVMMLIIMVQGIFGGINEVAFVLTGVVSGLAFAWKGKKEIHEETTREARQGGEERRTVAVEHPRHSAIIVFKEKIVAATHNIRYPASDLTFEAENKQGRYDWRRKHGG